MAQKSTSTTEKKTMSSREKDILNENVPAPGTTKGNQNEGFLPFVSSMLVCCSPRRSRGALRKFLTDSSPETSCESESEAEKVPECAVCLQTCIHPVRLPCSHIFCFLCVKGVANQSKRCALCRQEIPMDFLNNPALLRRQDLLKVNGFDDGFQWFYEGRNGWWQYDERTSNELEDRLKRDIKAFEILIAGFLYVIDLDQMVQIRRNDPTRRRRIKRDLATIAKKGVAGLKTANDENNVEGSGTGEQQNDTTPAIRVGADGDDMSRFNDGGGDGRQGNTTTAATTTTVTGNQLHPSSAVNVALDHTLLNTMSNLSVSLPTGGSPSHGNYGGSPHRSPNRGGSVSRDLSPSHNLNNSPQTPDTTVVTPETPDSTTEEMNRNLEELALTPSGRYRHLHRHGRRRQRNRNRNRHYDEYGRPRLHLLETSSSSSDSDWDYWY